MTMFPTQLGLTDEIQGPLFGNHGSAGCFLRREGNSTEKFLKTWVRGLTNTPTVSEKLTNIPWYFWIKDHSHAVHRGQLEMRANSPDLSVFYKLEAGKFHLPMSILKLHCHWNYHCTTLAALQIIYYSPESSTSPKSCFSINSAHFNLVNSDISPALQLKLKIAPFIS